MLVEVSGDGGNIVDRPDGQIQFRVPLPKMEAGWVVGAFAMDASEGLALIHTPLRFDGARRFYFTLEVPEVGFWGEQFGVRVCLFNYWTYFLEACSLPSFISSSLIFRSIVPASCKFLDKKCTSNGCKLAISCLTLDIDVNCNK